MSIQASVWAQKIAPAKAPTDRAILMYLADYASADGTDAYPATATLAELSQFSERTVRDALDRLQAAGAIVPSTSGLVEKRIKRKDRRPQSWDLQLHRVRQDLGEERLRELVKTNPVLWDGLERGAAASNDELNGVQLLPERGAAAAPKPSLKPSPSSLKEKKEGRPARLGARGRPALSVVPSAPEPELDPVELGIKEALDLEGLRPQEDEEATVWCSRLIHEHGPAVLAEWRQLRADAHQQVVADRRLVAEAF